MRTNKRSNLLTPEEKRLVAEWHATLPEDVQRETVTIAYLEQPSGTAPFIYIVASQTGDDPTYDSDKLRTKTLPCQDDTHNFVVENLLGVSFQNPCTRCGWSRGELS